MTHSTSFQRTIHIMYAPFKVMKRTPGLRIPSLCIGGYFYSCKAQEETVYNRVFHCSSIN